MSRRAQLDAILRQAVDPNSTTIQGSLLAAQVRRAPENLPSITWPWLVGVPLIIFGALAAVFCAGQLNQPDLGWAILGGTALLALLFAQSATRRLKVLSEFGQSLQMTLDELKDLRRHLANYLDDFDVRTSKYFHCITTTKVSSYAMLRQILMELDKFIAEGTAVLANPNREGLLSLDEALRGSITFRDGFVAGTGSVHTIPLVELKSKLKDLVEFVENDLLALEEEMKMELNPQAKSTDPEN